MRILALIFFLAVGSFMMMSAMCNKQTAKPTRSVFPKDNPGTQNPGDTTGPGEPTYKTGWIKVTAAHTTDPTTPMGGVLISIHNNVQEAIDNQNVLDSAMIDDDGNAVYFELDPGQYYVYGEVQVGSEYHDSYNLTTKDNQVVPGSSKENAKQIKLLISKR